MRKSAVYLIMGVSIGIVVISAVLLIALYKLKPRAKNILELYQDDAKYSGLTIRYPLDETLFPPEITPPKFYWKDDNSRSYIWLISIRFQDNKGRMNFFTREPRWTPEPAQWEAIKKQSLEKYAQVTILGINRWIPRKILSADQITIKTSKDKVGAPIFYREVNLPFIDTVKDPSQIRWRLGDISAPQQPPIILENMPVCGNCHSFSAQGEILAMDVDYANSKGSYVITRIAEQMVLATSDIITWNDYRKEDGEQTFGLLSQLSP
ncbi:MAG: hypothetical protein ACYTFW_18750, partial [Planctomycetota bacterium]